MKLRPFLRPDAIILHDVVAREYWSWTLVPQRPGRFWDVLRAHEDGVKFNAFMYAIARRANRVVSEPLELGGWSPSSTMLASDDPELCALAWKEIDRAEQARGLATSTDEDASVMPLLSHPAALGFGVGNFSPAQRLR